MKTGEKILCAVSLALVGAVVYLELSRRGNIHVKWAADIGVGDGEAPESYWLAQPSDIGQTLRRPHPLYRRPHTSRANHQLLCTSGWRSWYLAPPSEDPS